jgi:putative PIN family toxin of toxin-antitoxin system
VLHRPRLARFIDVDLRAELLDQLVSGTIWFEPAISVTDCRDPTDNKYLELAPAAQAATIVSSDQDPLVLQPWRGMRPAEYLAREAPLNP